MNLAAAARVAAMLGMFLGLAAAPASAENPPPLRVEIDAHEVPELADWAEQVRDVCVKQYPMIIQRLGGPGFTPPDHVKIVLTRRKGVAWTGGNVMTFSADYFARHRNDLGAAVHELCHVVQHYPPSRAGWLVEGIADHVRWFGYEPESARPRVDPKRAKYTDGYRTAAAFLDWAQRTTDPQLVAKLNAALRAGKYDDALFTQYTGTPLPELWQRFLASLRQSR